MDKEQRTPAAVPASATLALLQEKASPWMRNLARILGILLVFVAVFLAAAPWQQSAFGSGRIVAYAPKERQQKIEAPIEGKITKWYVGEGTHVAEGDLIAEISDNDPEILKRLENEKSSLQDRIDFLKKRNALIQDRASFVQVSQRAAKLAATSRVSMAQQRLRAAQQSVLAAKAADNIAALNNTRQTELFDKGLSSARTKELASLEKAKTATELERAEAALSASRMEQAALQAEQLRIESEFNATLQDIQSSQAQVAAEIANLEGEMARMMVRLARQQTQFIKSPQKGVILRLLVNPGAEMVKAGVPIGILVPDAVERAVELWMDGNDIPLISEGRHVRLQFEGWPSVQFTGWPSVAVGTFGGTVSLVDATDNGNGQFRVLILPDVAEPWPEPRFLRQGVRVHGWVLLNRVRLGYELWRQFNGFPPALPDKPAGVERQKTQEEVRKS